MSDLSVVWNLFCCLAVLCSDMLKMLGLGSVQERRLHQELIYTYKIIFVFVDLDCSSFFLSLSAQMKQPVDMLVNYLYITVVWMFGSTFCNQVVRIWNNLPATIEYFASMRKFKRHA